MKKKLIPMAILPVLLGGCSFNPKQTSKPSPTGEPTPVIPSEPSVPSVKPSSSVEPSPTIVPTVSPSETPVPSVKPTTPVEPSPTEVVPTVKPTEPTKPVTPSEPVVPTPTKEPTSEPYYNEEFEKFFNPSSKIEIELDFTNQAIYRLNEYGVSRDFVKEEMYHPCNMKITIDGKSETYEEIGARMKGNLSREDTEGFVSSDGHFNHGASPFHLKLNFTKVFNSSAENDYYQHAYSSSEQKARSKRKLADMKKIDLKWNRNYDPSFTKELYALQAFRDEGLIAQHGNLVSLTVKSESDSYNQTYLAYESFDKQLIKKYFNNPSKEDGDLYKCTYNSSGPADMSSTNSIGVETNYFKPIYSLKTNEDTSDLSSMKNLISKLSTRNTSASEYKQVLDSMVDVDNYLRFQAMSWVVGNPDDMRNNYNNYYVYFSSDNNKAYFGAYDNDRVFGTLNNWSIDTSRLGMSDDRLDGTASGGGCSIPIIRRTIVPGSSTRPIINDYLTKYQSYCVTYANKYLNVSKFKDFTNQFYYSSHNLNEGNENMSFAQYASNKLSTIK